MIASRLRLTLCITLCTGFMLLLVARAETSTPAAPTEPPAAFARVALCGASVTDGFLIPHEVHAMISLADTLAAACAFDAPLPMRRSSALFFFEPRHYATRYLEQIEAYDPTLLIAVDFLFWFGYGWNAENQRVARLDEGLKLLERFHCPVVIGSFPDVSAAATRGVGIHGGPMIAVGQVPQPDTLRQLNERVAQFAATHQNVIVVPMGEFLGQLAAGTPIDVRGNRYGADGFTRLMDQDLLHPNFEGLSMLTLLICDTLVKHGVASDQTFTWDAARVREKALGRRAAERAIRMRNRPTR